MDLLLLRTTAGDRRAVSTDDRPGTRSGSALCDARPRSRRSRRTRRSASSRRERRPAREQPDDSHDHRLGARARRSTCRGQAALESSVGAGKGAVRLPVQRRGCRCGFGRHGAGVCVTRAGVPSALDLNTLDRGGSPNDSASQRPPVRGSQTPRRDSPMKTLPPQHVDAAYRFGPFHLDVRERRLSRGAEVIPLRLKVFETLRVLVQNAGRLVTKQDAPRHGVAGDGRRGEQPQSQRLGVAEGAGGSRDGSAVHRDGARASAIASSHRSKLPFHRPHPLHRQPRRRGRRSGTARPAMVSASRMPPAATDRRS